MPTPAVPPPSPVPPPQDPTPTQELGQDRSAAPAWPYETEPVYEDEAQTVVAGLRSQPRKVKALLHYACNQSLPKIIYSHNAYPGHHLLMDMAEDSLFMSAKRQELATIHRHLHLDPSYLRCLADLVSFYRVFLHVAFTDSLL